MSDNGLFEKVYNPDVLSCLANLSNDEVFTPPEIVNQMLDTLPQELFKNPDTKFLDPACKTGVFLREIAKRLIKGLERQMPDLQQRVDHIFKNQLYGIAITELTSLLSRRGVYCSKYANSDFSVTKFTTADGNIRYKRLLHTWKDGRCIYCGANKEQYDRGDELETHAYEFIHTLNAEEIFNMKFDVIISNPPYQLSDGGAQASAIPLYNKFVETAIKLKPAFVCMIIPARWMTGGRGLDNFRDRMIHDQSIQILHDFADSNDCFNGVDVQGGVCYFKWNKNYKGKCQIYRHNANEISISERYLVEGDDKIYIRENQLISIKNKVTALKEPSFENIVSSMKPYGIRGDFFANPAKYKLPSISDNPIKGGYSILGLAGFKRVTKYLSPNYPIPNKSQLLSKWKIFIPRNYGCDAIGEGQATPVLSTPVLAAPMELCTETFLEIGGWDSRTQAENALSYLKTKFFRCLVGIRKQDQGASKAVYHYVPMQDFSKPWTDEELYKKYNLSQEKIDFIESMIKPME